ncbi:transposase, partial [Streptococcus pneumoniae]
VLSLFKMMVAETSIVKKNHQIPRIINQKIAQKLIEKNSMTDIAHQLSISTSTVIRKLNDFHFKHDFSRLPEIMSWDEYAFTKGKMSFIAQDFEKLDIITVLEGRTQAVIRDHFLKYDRAVRCRVKIITMDMFSPYYDLAFQISRLRLKQSPRLFHSRMLKSFLIAFILYNILAVL